MGLFGGRRRPNNEDRWRSVREERAFPQPDSPFAEALPERPADSPAGAPAAHESLPAPPAGPGPTAAESCASVVSAGSTWEGSLKLDGSVRIDGRLSGEVEAKETVHITKEAQVEATIRAAFVVIGGTFHGQVECGERVELLPASHTTGELETKSLTVHEGAFIDGQIRMTTGGAAGQQPALVERPSSAARRTPARPVAAPPQMLETLRLVGEG